MHGSTESQARNPSGWGDPLEVVMGFGGSYKGTKGDDDLKGTSDKDFFDIHQGGHDTVRGLAGNDYIIAGASLDPDDHIDGGKGHFDTLDLDGDYSAGLVFGAKTVVNVEHINLDAGFSYDLTLNANMVHAGGILSVVMQYQADDAVIIDGSAVQEGELALFGSNAVDRLIGGQDRDVISGGNGGDVLTGGGGSDLFLWQSTSESKPAHPDLITDFADDQFQLADVDGDSTQSGSQPLHYGATPGHTGDITVTYDAKHDLTLINVFTDADAKPDMVIDLTGNHVAQITADNFILH